MNSPTSDVLGSVFHFCARYISVANVKCQQRNQNIVFLLFSCENMVKTENGNEESNNYNHVFEK